MIIASDFRRIARDSLKGRWGVAVIAGLLASLLGGAGTGSFNLNFIGNSEDSLEFSNFNIGERTIEEIYPALADFFVGFIIIVVISALIMSIAVFILSSVVGLGYARFNLTLVDRRIEPQIDSLFSYFKHWKTAAVANLLQGLYILLWTLLCVIPGIVAAYNYAMTRFILAENPELPAREAVARSKEMMEGNRWRLFCLEMSFFGWMLLSILTCGIGSLWLFPYQQAAVAAFYREISGTECAAQPVDPVQIENTDFS